MQVFFQGVRITIDNRKDLIGPAVPVVSWILVVKTKSVIFEGKDVAAGATGATEGV